MRRTQQRLSDESGMTYVFVGLGMMAFLSASVLAIDVGMLMTAKNQAQNSADAGALAGATALAFDDYNNRTTSGPAVTSAISAATVNQVMRQSVSVTPGDVQFVNDAAGQANRVRVTVFRGATRGNPLSTLVAKYFNVATANVTATATAEASNADTSSCVKPFTIPDRWTERQTGGWDPTDTFTAYPKSPSLQPDVYSNANSLSYTGYDPARDRGLQLTLKAAAAGTIAPGSYYPVKVGASNGITDYQWNIENCNTSSLAIGSPLASEVATVAAATKNAVDALIAKDPTAYWDTSSNRVVSSVSPSPRTVTVPVYDPYVYDTAKKNSLPADIKASNYVGFFIENVKSNGDITGRITPIAGTRTGTATPPVGSFAKSIRLVQ